MTEIYKPGKPLGKSKWIGRWGVYWRIKRWEREEPELQARAEELAGKFPWTWEARLILSKIEQEKNEQCDSQSSTGS